MDDFYTLRRSFIIIGDIFHVVAVTILVVHIFQQKSCKGVSGRSQLLFAIASICKYLEYWLQLSLNVLSVARIPIVFLTCFAVALIYVVFKPTYEHGKDAFPTELLMTLSFVLTVWNAYITSDCIPIQVTVFFGMYLECMAIIPQFYMTIAERKVKKGMVRFPMALALYKFMYFVQSFIPFSSKDDTIEACFAFTYLTFFLLYSIVFYCVGIDVTEIEDKPPEYKLSLIEDSDHILKLNSGETEGCAQNEKI